MNTFYFFFFFLLFSFFYAEHYILTSTSSDTHDVTSKMLIVLKHAGYFALKQNLNKIFEKRSLARGRGVLSH